MPTMDEFTTWSDSPVAALGIGAVLSIGIGGGVGGAADFGAPRFIFRVLSFFSNANSRIFVLTTKLTSSLISSRSIPDKCSSWCSSVSTAHRPLPLDFFMPVSNKASDAAVKVRCGRQGGRDDWSLTTIKSLGRD